MTAKKKLIEVALPLDAINKASAREKSIRHGHPSTLHLWWARRPLAAARAVIFAQMVDDPSAHPDQFPTAEAQEQERQRLFRLIEELVRWENTTNETVLAQARDELWKSWRATCATNKDHPRATELFNPDKLPAFHDPFAGGGALPLEAQRLGLESYASDLNPVAVLINKAMIEIPPKFAGRPPVNPHARKAKSLIAKTWQGAQGLAEDARFYGQWMHDEAEKRIGHLYPKVEVTAEMAKERPDLKPLVGRKLIVIAWLWARTVKSPNPAFSQVDVPLASTFMLSTKTGAVSIYLAFAISKVADRGSSLTRWMTSRDSMYNTFSRQALPMTWDFVEVNALGEQTGGFSESLRWTLEALEGTAAIRYGTAFQMNVADLPQDRFSIFSTDPPYYDNVPYADLSDFFYVWLRRSLKPVFPELFSTLDVPKIEELVATRYRHGGKEKAEAFFLNGMAQAMHRLAGQAHPDFPVTIYYAFKQSETESEAGTSSTGWETFLDAVIQAGFALSGTWPMRTELANRMRGMDSNALASSIVLVCRPRAVNAPTTTRREFLNALKAELPDALIHLQHGNIAPVDLAQAAIGPGMAVYTRYARVLDAEGKSLSVREALALINQTLDEVLAEQEGDFDADSRWALAWFEQSGFAEGEYGVAETLSTAKNTSVAGMVEACILVSKSGKVRLLRPDELPSDWNPATDQRLTAWEAVHQLIRVLEAGGESAAAALVAELGSHAETARELAYRLYTLCERKKRAAEALSYNGLVQSWPEITRLARETPQATPVQTALL